MVSFRLEQGFDFIEAVAFPILPKSKLRGGKGFAIGLVGAFFTVAFLATGFTSVKDFSIGVEVNETGGGEGEIFPFFCLIFAPVGS